MEAAAAAASATATENATGKGLQVGPGLEELHRGRENWVPGAVRNNNPKLTRLVGDARDIWQGGGQLGVAHHSGQCTAFKG